MAAASEQPQRRPWLRRVFSLANVLGLIAAIAVFWLGVSTRDTYLAIALAAIGAGIVGGAVWYPIDRFTSRGSLGHAVDGIPYLGAIPVDDSGPAPTLADGHSASSFQSLLHEIEGQTTVLWLIEEGEDVEPGDLLVELDTSDLLDEKGIRVYQSMIGALQWSVTLGRFDIACAVMCMSRFRAAPRTGHLKRLHQLYSYLRFAPDAAIRFRTGIPNNESLFPEPSETFDWSRTPYGSTPEERPDYMPTPKGCRRLGENNVRRNRTN